jgi:hypothetical protein
MLDGTTGVYRDLIISLAARHRLPAVKGEKPADLPMQVPTKYETVINLKTAKGLGLDVVSALNLPHEEAKAGREVLKLRAGLTTAAAPSLPGGKVCR